MTALLRRPTNRRERLLRVLVFSLLVVVVFAIAEALSGSSELTAPGTAAAALRLSIPILLAGLGGLIAERSGVINIGLEGMMIGGTWFAAWGSWQFGPVWGVVLGIAGGAIFGLIHAIATVTFTVDHIVSGVAINILALGSMRFLSSIIYTAETGGSIIQSPVVRGLPTFNLPLLAGGNLFGWRSPDFLGWLHRTDVLLLSDVAGILRGATGGVSWLTLIAILLVPTMVFALWRTPWGLRLRSCGEDPWAAESLGVPVLRMKYYALTLSGALAGLGGAFLVLVQAGIYRESMTAGRGFIGLGAMIFGNWRPTGVLAGALVFGFGDSLQFRGSGAVRALLLAIGIGLAALVVYHLSSRLPRAAIIGGVTASAVIGYYLAGYGVPSQALRATPYVLTLLVLAVATQRLRPPAADGARYRKGEAR